MTSYRSMISRNEIKIIGNIGSNPITRESNGVKSVNFPVATSENWTSKTGEQKSSTQWHKVVLHGNLCDMANLLRTGMSVCIFGKIRTYQWQENGEDKTSVKVIAQSIFVSINEIRKLQEHDSDPSKITEDRSLDSNSKDSVASGEAENNFDDLPF